MPQFVRLRVQKGDDYRRDFVCKDADGVANDLTGCALKMQIKNATGAVILELSTDNGGIVLTPASGLFSLVFTHAQTAAIAVDSGVYDVQLTDSAGEITTLFGGDVMFMGEVTQ